LLKTWNTLVFLRDSCSTWVFYWLGPDYFTILLGYMKCQTGNTRKYKKIVDNSGKYLDIRELPRKIMKYFDIFLCISIFGTNYNFLMSYRSEKPNCQISGILMKNAHSCKNVHSCKNALQWRSVKINDIFTCK
jgi:hypothetical protein